MNVLFYLSHPAQFHFVKHTVAHLKSNNHRVIILIKTKDILENLVLNAGWSYTNIQQVPRHDTKLSMALASIHRTLRVVRIAKANHVDILVGTDASLAQAAFLLRKVSITTLEDDFDVIPKLARVTYPFSTYLLVPASCDVGNWSRKKLGYAGFMKLAYLHPNVFRPQFEVLRSYNITLNRPFFIIRLVSLVAHHDVRMKGISRSIVNRLIELLSEKGNVYISSERPLEYEFEKYRLKINPLDMHHILAYASIYVGDSQSMAVEAAMLGVPSIRFNDFVGKIGVLEELEHVYGLTFGIPTSNPQKLYDIVSMLLSRPDINKEFKARRQKMLSDKIDVSAFLTWFIEHYPQSSRIMRDNPDYQYNFR